MSWCPITVGIMPLRIVDEAATLWRPPDPATLSRPPESPCTRRLRPPVEAPEIARGREPAARCAGPFLGARDPPLGTDRRGLAKAPGIARGLTESVLGWCWSSGPVVGPEGGFLMSDSPATSDARSRSGRTTRCWNGWRWSGSWPATPVRPASRTAPICACSAWWLTDRQVRLLQVQRTHIELYGRWLEEEGRAARPSVGGCRPWPGTTGTAGESRIPGTLTARGIGADPSRTTSPAPWGWAVVEPGPPPAASLLALDELQICRSPGRRHRTPRRGAWPSDAAHRAQGRQAGHHPARPHIARSVDLAIAEQRSTDRSCSAPAGSVVASPRSTSTSCVRPPARVAEIGAQTLHYAASSSTAGSSVTSSPAAGRSSQKTRPAAKIATTTVSPSVASKACAYAWRAASARA